MIGLERDEECHQGLVCWQETVLKKYGVEGGQIDEVGVEIGFGMVVHVVREAYQRLSVLTTFERGIQESSPSQYSLVPKENPGNSLQYCSPLSSSTLPFRVTGGNCLMALRR